MYACTVNIYVEDDIEKTYKKLCKKYKIDCEDGFMAGVVIPGELNNYHYLLSKHYVDHNTIGHELHHLVIKIMKDRGITDEESSAWLSGYLNNIIYKSLEKKKLYPFHG